MVPWTRGPREWQDCHLSKRIPPTAPRGRAGPRGRRPDGPRGPGAGLRLSGARALPPDAVRAGARRGADLERLRRRRRPRARGAPPRGHGVVPGYAPHAVPPDAAVLEALRGAHARGARIASVCTGASPSPPPGCSTAAARPRTGATRTSSRADRRGSASVRRPLRRRRPRVVTSAGVAAGIDLCLHLVRVDHGAAVANAVARAHRRGPPPLGRAGPVRRGAAAGHGPRRRLTRADARVAARAPGRDR